MGFHKQDAELGLDLKDGQMGLDLKDGYCKCAPSEGLLHGPNRAQMNPLE